MWCEPKGLIYAGRNPKLSSCSLEILVMHTAQYRLYNVSEMVNFLSINVF